MAEAVDPPFDRPDAGFNALEGWTWIGCYLWLGKVRFLLKRTDAWEAELWPLMLRRDTYLD